MEDLVLLCHPESEMQAQMIKSQLEAEGIASIIQLNSASGMLPYLQFVEGINLLVSPQDLEKATQILKTLD